jgi:hypothetical protein
MNSAIEFHDSEVASVRAVSGDLRLQFSAAYVHRSVGRPGIDSGEGFIQPAEVVFSNAVHSEANGPCIGAISDGAVVVNGEEYANHLPVPFAARGKVSGSFTFASGGVLTVAGAGVSCQVSGEAKFVEKYDG